MRIEVLLFWSYEIQVASKWSHLNFPLAYLRTRWFGDFGGGNASKWRCEYLVGPGWIALDMKYIIRTVLSFPCLLNKVRSSFLNWYMVIPVCHFGFATDTAVLGWNFGRLDIYWIIPWFCFVIYIIDISSFFIKFFGLSAHRGLFFSQGKSRYVDKGFAELSNFVGVFLSAGCALSCQLGSSGISVWYSFHVLCFCFLLVLKTEPMQVREVYYSLFYAETVFKSSLCLTVFS